MSALLFASFPTLAQSVKPQVLGGHVPAAAKKLAPVGRLPGQQHLNIAIGLPLRNQAALSALLHDLYNPASANYHQWLTPAQFADVIKAEIPVWAKIIKASGAKATD